MIYLFTVNVNPDMIHLFSIKVNPDMIYLFTSSQSICISQEVDSGRFSFAKQEVITLSAL